MRGPTAKKKKKRSTFQKESTYPHHKRRRMDRTESPEGLPVIKKSSHANPRSCPKPRNVAVQATARRPAQHAQLADSPRPASPAPTALPPTSSSSSSPPHPLKAPSKLSPHFTPQLTQPSPSFLGSRPIPLLPFSPPLLFRNLLLCSITLRLVLARESSEACPFRFRLIQSLPIQSKLLAWSQREEKDRGDTTTAQKSGARAAMAMVGALFFSMSTAVPSA
jgi:hypothetical protein